MKLNPCPRCGCEDTYLCEDEHHYFAVKCPRYGCCWVPIYWYSSKEDALEAWEIESHIGCKKYNAYSETRVKD